MAAHRYWRVYVRYTASQTDLTIGELVLATTPGGTQAATGGTPSASSSQAGSGQGSPAQAFDGTVVTGNYWSPGSGVLGVTGTWLSYDMGSGGGIDVVEVRITSPAGATATHYPTSMALLYSDDGKAWTVQKSWTGLVFTNLETKTLDATPFVSSVVFNRVMSNRDIRNNSAMNVGNPPSVSKILPHRISGAGYRHATLPTLSSPYTGMNYIAGSTTVLGLPYSRRVNLHDQKSGTLIQTLYTAKDGAFLFEYLSAGPWAVVGVDPAAEQNSVIYAHIVPAPMV